MKKAQLKIQQMAFMLIAVTLFFVLIGMFVLTIYVSELKNSAGILDEKNALLLVTKLANSPEFSCGEAFGNLRTNCIDADKVMILKERILNYKNFWDVENIEIRKIYPKSENKECTLDNYPDCNIIKIRDGNITTEHSNFVSLCRKKAFEGESENKCELAKLMISYNGN
tara:strand:+ start:19213 stop:19719 length:507 start_codon:yes stop_codon:yes gene_type:complete